MKRFSEQLLTYIHTALGDAAGLTLTLVVAHWSSGLARNTSPLLFTAHLAVQQPCSPDNPSSLFPLEKDGHSCDIRTPVISATARCCVKTCVLCVTAEIHNFSTVFWIKFSDTKEVWLECGVVKKVGLVRRLGSRSCRFSPRSHEAPKVVGCSLVVSNVVRLLHFVRLAHVL